MKRVTAKQPASTAKPNGVDYHLQCQPKAWMTARPWVTINRGTLDLMQRQHADYTRENFGFRFRIVSVTEIKSYED